MPRERYFRCGVALQIESWVQQFNPSRLTVPNRKGRQGPADVDQPTWQSLLWPISSQFKKLKRAPILFQEFFFWFFLERAESVDHIIVLQMAPCIRAYPVAAPLIVCGLARVWAAKMGKAVTSSFCKWPHHPASVEVAAESWRFPPLSL